MKSPITELLTIIDNADYDSSQTVLRSGGLTISWGKSIVVVTETRTGGEWVQFHNPDLAERCEARRKQVIEESYAKSESANLAKLRRILKRR
jgi:hypothetical protein